jgi:hypothetical protein
MSSDILPATLEMMGSVLIGWAALRVHHRVLNEHRIDKKAVRVMRFEQKLGTLGIVLIVAGYVLQLTM